MIIIAKVIAKPQSRRGGFVKNKLNALFGRRLSSARESFREEEMRLLAALAVWIYYRRLREGK